ncbi:MAG: NPCBM/NEW2 domain-containing protein, partial [Pirellulaceae bacterium]
QPRAATGAVAEPMTEHPMDVLLVDGSVLAAERYVVERNRAIIKLVGGGEAVAPIRAVRAARFNKQGETVRKQWLEILESPATADAIVIRKVTRVRDGDDEQIEIGLDQLEGVLFDINDEVVEFEFDDTRVDVPREKVEGVAYYRPQRGKTPDAVCRVVDRFGTSWNVKSVRLQDDTLHFVSAAGVACSLPLEQLGKLDYSAANLLFLTDMQPESIDWKPYVHSSATPASLGEWFRPRWDSVPYGGPLTLGGQSYERGLALHSRTEIAFRLTGEYRRFLATVGVDDRFRNTGNVRLVISSERKVLFDQLISGTDEPIDLDIDVRGVRRLRVLVDFGDDRSDSGDHLNLCHARLTK